MNELQSFAWVIPQAVVERLGWVLLHSLWQFALAAAFAGFVLRTMRQNSAPARHAVLLVAMALLVVAPVATWMVVPSSASDRSANQQVLVAGRESDVGTTPRPEASPPASGTFAPDKIDPVSPAPDLAASNAVPEPVPPGSPPVPATVQPSTHWSQQVTAFLRPWLAWIVAGWSLGVVLYSIRPLLGWHMLRRLRREGVSPVSDDVLAAVNRVSERLGLRCALQVLQSTLIQVPVVIGYVRPVILLPVSLITSIPVAQLEAILAHELAHVRRHDFVVNLLQTLIETIFFYHPAVWWLSRQLRVEREHCCDDLVVTLLGNRIEYGRALVAIEQMRGQNTVLALGATDGSLLSRVRRILGVGTGDTVSIVGRWPAALLGTALICVIFVLTMNWGLAAMDDQGRSGDGEVADAKKDKEKIPEEAKINPGQMRVKNADGSRALFSSMVAAHVGFPKGPPASWAGDQSREGLVSLAGLPVGTHWMLAAGDFEQRTLFHVKIPTDQPILERRLRAARTWVNKNVGVKSNVEIDNNDDEIIIVDIHNGTKGLLQVSEEDVQLTTDIERTPVRGLSPKWHTGGFPVVKIDAGETGRMRLSWREWGRKGLWTSRMHEPMHEPVMPEAEPGKTWVRVSVGNHGALPVSVTVPQPHAKAEDILSRKVSLTAKAMNQGGEDDVAIVAKERILDFDVLWDQECLLSYQFFGLRIGTDDVHTIKFFYGTGRQQKTTAMAEIPIRDGQVHGKVRRWSPDGMLLLEVRFVKGRIHGECRFYSHSGKLLGVSILNNGSGKYSVWNASYEDPTLVRETLFVDGKEASPR